MLLTIIGVIDLLLTLFFISCIIALLFIWIGERSKHQLIKKSFRIYAGTFTILTIVLFITSFIQLRPTIQKNIQHALQPKKSEVQTETHLTSEYNIKGAVSLEAPLVQQMPELPRGCEVTSLAMLLAYHDIKADKLELAKEVTKDNSSYKEIGDDIHFGNPHDGFVGDMYSFDKPGLGVYNEPIEDLLKNYIDPAKINNFSGENFEEIIKQLNQDRPVWVIINGAYDRLPDSSFTTWHTKSGPVRITMREHSVLVTGYDDRYIYFNDPLAQDSKAPIDNFRDAWEQMGKQAITIK